MSTTLKTKLENLRKEHAKKLELAEISIRIEHELEELFPDLSIMHYNHSAYGVTGNIKIQTRGHKKLLGNKRNPEYKDAVRLAEFFPPIPMTMVRDSCLSFRPKVSVDELPEEKKKHWREENEVVPFILKLSCFQYSSMTLKWFSMYGDDTISVECGFPMKTEITQLYMTTVKDAYSKVHEKKMVLNVNNNNIHTIYDEENNAVAQLQQPIKWASSSKEIPNDYTLYWISYTPENKATIADLLRPVMID